MRMSNDKDIEYGKKLYHKLADVVCKEVYEQNSSPLFTVRAVALCLVRVSIALVGYEKANEVITKAVNEAMRGNKPKGDNDGPKIRS